MISLYPTFYHTFQCKANQCHHTCCQKWTIDVDEETAKLYQTLPTPLGEDLRKFMTVDDEGYYFMFSDKQPTCPLLREDGLCRVVLELGEDSLCDTCHMHPRFYKYIEDLELCGVGLSCEESVEKLLATEGDQLLFTIEDDDGEFTTKDRPVLENIFDLLALGISPAICQFTPNHSIRYCQKLISVYKETEPIDEEWTKQLAHLEDMLSSTTAMNTTDLLTLDAQETATLNKVYQYILYRQIDMLAEYSLESLVRYAFDATVFIALLTHQFGNLPEQIRRWSEQIEYDEDNVAFLFNEYENSNNYK
ncbi:flagellin lysine-N-methylase [Veillonella sp.]|uniref:flagellin lysine-N-methylase n=1 Tax=Veillonella sp. TaxID=1926307 RepID=UPI0025D282BB|nr:flagellin lysine-N-methylase [Veillonella sp.]